MYLAIDPGKGAVDSIGAAKFSATGDVLFMGQFTYDDFVPWLEEQKGITEVVYEEYRIFARKAKQHIGSKVETVECIGTIKSWCTRHAVPMTSQRSDILPVAEKLFQVYIPADHTISHQFSALLHGLFYLYRLGITKSALERELENERG